MWQTIAKAIFLLMKCQAHYVAQLIQALCYNQNVAGSVADEIILFIYLRNPFGHSVTLELTGPLT
jgi:hypothetical protein